LHNLPLAVILVKIQAVILLLVLIALVSCNDTSDNKPADKESLKIVVEVVPEDDSSYSISWKDTIGQSRGYKLNDRPSEIWCFVQDKNDTVGYYRGLSTPADFTYFTTRDTLVTATFLIGPNIFSEQRSSNENIVQETAIEFNPVSINLKNEVRKSIELVLTERRKLLLTEALKKSG
jgi:hypothetical protein